MVFRGVLLGGVTGVKRGNVLILGAGNVGLNAAKMAVGLNANVTITDVNLTRLAYIDDLFGSKITTLYSSDANIREALKDADLVIGSVLLPGKGLMNGVNCYAGKCTFPGVAEALKLEYVAPETLM